MSYLLTHALENALAVTDLETKQQALRGFVEEVCRLHDSKYKAVTFPNDAVVSASDRSARERVMGAPARYVEVLWAGQDTTFETSDDVHHLFNVFVYRGLRKPDQAAEDAFRALMESRSASKPGLLFACRAQQTIEVQAGAFAGHELLLGPPSRVTATLVQLADASGDWRHECAFAITVA